MSTKRFVIRVDGHDHEVDVQPVGSDGAFEVVVDGARHRVHRAPDRGWRVTGAEGTAHHTVHLGGGTEARPNAATSDGHVAPLEIRSAAEAALANALADKEGGGGGGASVQSPMPGRVVRVLVDVGAEVERDQPLIIVEAMKMENEVCAPSAGTVSKVAATAGQTVDAGHLLIELAPHPDSARG